MPDEQRSRKKKDPKAARRTGDAELVNRLLVAVEKKISGEDVKVTLSDYIRLMQLRKDLEEDRPKEVRVQWVDGPGRKESGHRETGVDRRPEQDGDRKS